MKTFRLVLAVSCVLGLAGCPEKIVREPDATFVDYGWQEWDANQPDSAATDANTPADATRDLGIDDNGGLPDVVEDTGPCTLVCPATMRCGPDPCGDGECLPGCSGSKPVCNLETRQCEAEVCVPDCGSKVCGYDGCGGPCGECPSRQYCNYTNGTCGSQCYPSCTGKSCGDDGCGKTCPPGCPSGVECHADGYCISEGKCQASGTELKCAAGSNSGSGDTAWGIGTTTMSLYNYSAACGSSFNPGPERAFKLVVEPNATGVLEVELSQSLPIMSDFLNVYVIEDTGDGCVAASCVAAGSGSNPKTLQYEVPASPTGHTYYLLADANVRNNGRFSITIKKCTWNGFDDSAVVESSDP